MWGNIVPRLLLLGGWLLFIIYIAMWVTQLFFIEIISLMEWVQKYVTYILREIFDYFDRGDIINLG